MRRILIVFFVILFTACANANRGTPTPAAPTIPTRTPTPAAPSDPVEQFPDTSSQPATLRLWTSAMISPYGETPAHLVLNEQLEQFRAANPDLQLDVQVKNLTGPGSIINYLRSGRDIAPDIMPDVILLPSEQIGTFRTENLLTSLDGVSTADWFPAALDLAISETGTPDAYPFALTNLHHLVWKTTVVTETIPVDWTSLIENEAMTLAFSAETKAATALPLHIYRSISNLQTDSDGNITPESAVLKLALQHVEDARNNGILTDPTMLTSDQQVLDAVLGEGVALGLVAAESLITLNSDEIAYDALPGMTALAPPIVSGLSWAVTTQDLERQARAVDLITFLTDAERLGRWSEAAELIPNSTAALEQWDNVAYAQFLGLQLKGAIGYANYDSAKSRAIAESVVSLVNDPQLSAEEATALLLTHLENNH